MKKFLMQQVPKRILNDDFITPIISYEEDINPDAINGQDWLDNNTSYIWKVAVLSIADGNKRDWAYLYIGHQRSPDHVFEFIGELYWSDGENDDIGRCLRRYLKCAENADILYEDD